MYRSLVVWNEILLYMYAFSAFCVHVCTLSFFFFFFCGQLALCVWDESGEGYILHVLPFVIKCCATQDKDCNVQKPHHSYTEQVCEKKKRPKFLRRGINLMHCRSETKKCTGSIVWCWWWRQCTLSTLHCPFCGPVPHNFLRQHTLSCCGKTFSHWSWTLVMSFSSPSATPTECVQTAGIVALVRIPVEAIFDKSSLIGLGSKISKAHSGLKESTSTLLECFLLPYCHHLLVLASICWY